LSFPLKALLNLEVFFGYRVSNNTQFFRRWSLFSCPTLVIIWTNDSMPV